MIKSEYGLTYEEFCKSLYDPDVDEMLPNGISLEEAFGILFHHFVEPDWYVSYPAGPNQMYAEVVAKILHDYPAGKIRRIPKIKKTL